MLYFISEADIHKIYGSAKHIMVHGKGLSSASTSLSIFHNV